jgi:hypothetical protein
MTTQQEKLNIEFPAEVCQELPKAGRRLTYVPVAEVITRLNDVLGTAGWSYTVEARWTDTHESKYGTEVWAMTHVRLVATIDGQQCARDGIGGYNTSKPGMDYADGWKSATSEALKKAAQALGVGLHLSRSEEAIAMAADLTVERADAAELQAFIAAMKEANSVIAGAVKQRAQELGASWNDMHAEHLTELKAMAQEYADNGVGSTAELQA